MWSEPYLETCCRSALHRLSLASSVGRPAALKDGPCLERLMQMRMARLRPDERVEITCLGVREHRVLVRSGSGQRRDGHLVANAGDRQDAGAVIGRDHQHVSERDQIGSSREEILPGDNG